MSGSFLNLIIYTFLNDNMRRSLSLSWRLLAYKAGLRKEDPVTEAASSSSASNSTRTTRTLTKQATTTAITTQQQQQQQESAPLNRRESGDNQKC